MELSKKETNMTKGVPVKYYKYDKTYIRWKEAC